MIAEIKTKNGKVKQARLNLGTMGRAMNDVGVSDMAELKGPLFFAFLHQYAQAALPGIDLDTELEQAELENLYRQATASIESNVAFFSRTEPSAQVPEKSE
jgi:hypothetical protein